MRPIANWLISVFASAPGVLVLAALDSTLFFSLPFGVDAVVVIVAARLQETAWLVPVLAAAGSLAGAALTFWMGIKIGDVGLERYVPEKRLGRLRKRVRSRGAVTLAALSLIPPPFPYTPFILAAGALEVRPAAFFTTLAAARIVRFGVETILAVRYGRNILRWLESDVFQGVVVACIVLSISLTTISLVRFARADGRRRAAA